MYLCIYFFKNSNNHLSESAFYFKKAPDFNVEFKKNNHSITQYSMINRMHSPSLLHNIWKKKKKNCHWPVQFFYTLLGEIIKIINI